MRPADLLVGHVLPGDWKVKQIVSRKPTATGGKHSTGYLVEQPNGRKGFLKAMDYTAAFDQPEHTAVILQSMTQAYIFERDLCNRCKGLSFGNIVHAIDGGTVVANPDDRYSAVEYLIFELADGDVRAHLDAQTQLDVAFIFRALHHIANGLDQLHRADIAHQDLKPSNVLVFQKEQVSKIADLGRAWSKDLVSPYDRARIAGDQGYAPPEALYGYVIPDERLRRFGCDMYHLGSMIVFFFTRVQITAIITDFLALEHRRHAWRGSYTDVLPYLQAAFAQALGVLESHVPEPHRKDISAMVAQMCDPDPRKRGHPLDRAAGDHNQFSLERYISALDRMAHEAEVALKLRKRGA